VRLAAAAVVVVAVAAFFYLRGNDGDVGTATGPTGTTSPTTSTASSAATTASTSAPPAVSAPPSSSSPAKRPPTLSFTVRYPAYITIRIPGGRTLVSKVYPSGAKASFDQKVLEVVNGRPQAVRFVVNGKPRKQGPAGQTETFVVRRR
jgi:hypothetical protein